MQAKNADGGSGSRRRMKEDGVLSAGYARIETDLADSLAVPT
jgi:hypothetical protein